MEDKEIRIMRLSKEAVFEIVWEFFMENGETIFKIKKNSQDLLFHFEEDCENNGCYIAVSKFDPSLKISDLDLEKISAIDSVYENADYSVIKL
ncbi:MAG: hypothetical protein IJT70_07925 [Clostridia bacterium]|nr:hypothetical protein [Clostridia bacterium]